MQWLIYLFILLNLYDSNASPEVSDKIELLHYLISNTNISKQLPLFHKVQLCVTFKWSKHILLPGSLWWPVVIVWWSASHWWAPSSTSRLAWRHFYSGSSSIYATVRKIIYSTLLTKIIKTLCPNYIRKQITFVAFFGWKFFFLKKDLKVTCIKI